MGCGEEREGERERDREIERETEREAKLKSMGGCRPRGACWLGCDECLEKGSVKSKEKPQKMAEEC